MMSHDPNPDNCNDNSFDRDIAELLDDLTQEFELSKPDSELDELVSLFDQDLSGSFVSDSQISSSLGQNSSALSPENEISNIFNENFASDQTSAKLPLDDTQENDLDQLLNESFQLSDDQFLSQLESNTDQFAQDNYLRDIDDLKQLLQSQDSQESIPLQNTISVSSEPKVRDFYLPLEDLESLIIQPAIDPNQESLDEATAAELIAFIEAPAILTSQSMTQPSAIESEKPPAKTSQSSIDHDLGDIDKELEDIINRISGDVGSASNSHNPGHGKVTKRAKPSVFEETMRVPVKQLDNLSNLIGELVVKRNRLEQDQERLRKFLDNLLNQVQNLSDVGGRMQDLYERTLLEGALLATRNQGKSATSTLIADNKSNSNAHNNQEDEGNLDALEMDRFTGFHLLSQEMIELIVRVRESASDIQFLVDETEQVSRNLRQATTQLQEGMTKSRMVPFAQTAERLPRALRNISLKLHKKANLKVEGRDVLVDKMIVEHLYDPMTHLVNNAMTHGIETPEKRQKLGKSAEGRITLQAFLQGNQTVITFSDDGGGIDREKVKTKAIQKGLITVQDAEKLSETEIFDLLFHPGFSTRDQVDDLAGRGVGLDVVRTELNEVRGSVTIDSVLGKGTTFTIRLPLTLSISKALCCVSDRARIAFPMDGVEDMKDYMPRDLTVHEDGSKHIKWEGQQIQVYPLGDLLSYNRKLSRS
ncbi:MAG TPA: hybrid sensor histidine kinase/response regulator, partial [Cyanothece sp. UBA12306]|nr:hybrid sensor histidine kinase/response regulator [Cyanothece sp. UBA12306]